MTSKRIYEANSSCRKGGVGKTTVAAATALRIAEQGRPVLVVSTDAAHSLGDVLDVPLGPEPRRIADNVDALHLDGCHELTHSWDTIRAYVQRLLGGTELELPLDELLIVPGLDELLALTRLRGLVGQGRWHTIVVDCAATAESLRLLSLPDVVGWYVERLFGRDAFITTLLKRGIQRSLSVPLPTKEVISALNELGDDLLRLRETLCSTGTTARIVLTPERVVIAEARRALSYLTLYGFIVDAVIINRVMPAELSGPFFRRIRPRPGRPAVARLTPPWRCASHTKPFA